jgi:hypothetical protein
MYKIPGGRSYGLGSTPLVHAAVRHGLMSIVTSTRGLGRAPRGQRALDLWIPRTDTGGPQRTADRQARVLLTTVYCDRHACCLLVGGGWE